MAHTDVIGRGHAVFPVEEAINFFEAGVCDLADILADFDLGDYIAIVVLDRAQLVHAAEHGIGFGGDKPLADAEGIDLSALEQQLGDEPLVEGV